MSDKKQIHPNIPIDRAWQTGRRIYVPAGYRSKLNQDLMALGAKWDSEVRARWVGSTKKAQLLPLLEAAQGRRDAAEQVKSLGYALDIPFEASQVRDAAKAVQAVFDGGTKKWYFRDRETLAQVTEQRDRWITNRDEAARLEREAREAEDAALIAEIREQEAKIERERAARRREELLAGRTPTGDEETIVVVSTRRMNKHEARESALQPGTVTRLADGRRGIVLDVAVRFTPEEMASSVCWHPETHDQAHWDITYTLAIVEPTAEEAAADVVEATEKADAAEIHAVHTAVDEMTRRQGVTPGWSTIPAEARVLTLTLTSGTVGAARGGTVILTADGRVVYQHPGYYDDYLHTEGVVTDPALVARVAALADGGTRSRVQPDQLPRHYQVDVRDGADSGAARG